VVGGAEGGATIGAVAQFPTAEDFEHQRRVIRETYPRLFDAVEDQLGYVGEHIGDLRPSTEPLNRYDLALRALLARATKSALGIVRACEHGFGEMAMSSLRTLGETMVSAYWMSLDPEARAEQFEAYARLEALETLELVDELGWGGDVDIGEELRDPEWITAVRARFPNRVQGWMQRPMNAVVQAIEPSWGEEGSPGRREFRNVVKILHLFGDRHSHVGAFDTIRLLRSDEDGQLAIQLGPGKRWVPQALVVCAWVYGQVFDLAAEHYELAELESWRRRWQLLLARCLSLDPAQTQGVGRNDPCPCGSGFKFKRCHLEVVR
jgi:hypothetical protein